MVIGISGKIGSGKSTFCSILQKKLEAKGKKVEFRNFADRLKKICFDLTGYYGYTQEEKNIYLEDFGMTVGEALQKIGTDAMRNGFHIEVWVISALRNLDKDTVYILGDMRFPNECAGIEKRGGITVRLDGDPAGVRANSKRDLNHISETALDNYERFNERFLNEGAIEKLEKFADKIIEKYL
jgi:hypothetical protein